MRVNLNTSLNIPKKEISIDKTIPKADFTQYVKSASHIIVKQQLDKELDKINKQGKKLCNSMSMADFVEYKKMVINFLDECISKGLNYKEHMLKSRFGKTKILSIVEKVNNKLVELLDEFICKNQDPIKVISLVDEMKGLLLDLYT